MTGPEWDFQTNVVEPILKWQGFDVVRLADVRANFQATAGTPDLYVRHPGKQIRVWIEVKAPESSHGLTDHQERWLETERECGGLAYLIASEQQLVDMLEEHGFEVELF